jgi:integrase
VWCILFKGLDGKWHRERTDATTKEQASRILAQKMSDVSEARLRGAPSIEALKPVTFQDFVDKEYLPHCQATHTLETYNTDRSLGTVLNKYFGKMLLRSVTSGDVQRYLDRCALEAVGKDEDGKAVTRRPATVNRRRTFLSGIFSEAERRSYVDRNPVRAVSHLPEHNDQLRWLTGTEEERLLGYAPEWFKPIILAALHTGMRRGELLKLKWADLDFDQRLVRASHTKNHKVRYIPMNQKLYALLESIDHFSGPKGPSPYVFTNPETGTRWKNVNGAIERTCEKAGFDDVTFHTLRHTFASRLAQAGVPLNNIRELLGHGDMKVTMRYAHLAPNNLREAVRTLENRTRIVQKRGRLRANS